jgi:hypothetical protein
MIPTIEDIFHSLSRGEMTFSDAEMYVREHIRLAANNEVELRDMFAAHAVSAFVHPEAWQSTVGEISKDVAFNAYTLADAMLAERERIR